MLTVDVTKRDGLWYIVDDGSFVLGGELAKMVKDEINVKKVVMLTPAPKWLIDKLETKEQVEAREQIEAGERRCSGNT